MFRRKGKAATVAETMQTAIEDAKLRQRLGVVAAHALAATRESRGRLRHLADNRILHRHLRELVGQLEAANRHRLRKRRNARFVRFAFVAVPVAVVAVPRSRSWIRERLGGAKEATGSLILPARGGQMRIEEQLDLDVPVSTAYNQWTQFEEFPFFMEGVEEVRQLDDKNLHWVASFGGSRAEWDARIVEQVPDDRIVWQSTDGKETRGTVSFSSRGESASTIRLTMTYTPEGVMQKVGSAAGLDARRVRGDLKRFKKLIESRGTEDGAWRGRIKEGATN